MTTMTILYTWTMLTTPIARIIWILLVKMYWIGSAYNSSQGLSTKLLHIWRHYCSVLFLAQLSRVFTSLWPMLWCLGWDLQNEKSFWENKTYEDWFSKVWKWDPYIILVFLFFIFYIIVGSNHTTLYYIGFLIFYRFNYKGIKPYDLALYWLF
jgi:hypothetical protein